MQDKDELTRRARDFIHGLCLMATPDNRESFKDFEPSRPRGICVVERCARAVETLCGGCQEVCCHRCMIAAELRSAKNRIHAERSAELAKLGFDDEDLEELINKVAVGLCDAHVLFGSVLVGQWYTRQNFLLVSP